MTMKKIEKSLDKLNHWEIDHHLQLLEETKNQNSQLLYQEPLKSLLEDSSVTEILVNSYKDIFFEKNGELIQSESVFSSENIYNQTLEEICQKAGTYLNKEKPFVEAYIDSNRFTIIYADLARGSNLLSIRKHPKDSFTLNDLFNKNWCNQKQYDLLLQIIFDRKNVLVVGGTSSGKTTALQALLHHIQPNERLVIIEDTQELKPTNRVSTSLLSATSVSNLPDINMTYLLKRALRLRPDRLIVGEVRGPEAKDLLMAMSTGHSGSMGTIHARNEQEAALRLEMLIQMGAPQWSIESIRKLIALTTEYILVVHKHNGQRKLEGIYKIQSLESTGFVFYKADEEY